MSYDRCGAPPFWLCSFLLLTCWVGTSGQNTAQHVLAPTINLNTNVSQIWRLNLKVQSRFQDPDGPESGGVGHALTDAALIASRKVRLSNRLGLGMMLRSRNDRRLVRAIQQYTIVKRYQAFRFSHRISSDQTWGAEDPLEWRVRYRALIQLPLNGQIVNAREPYLKIGNEYLQSLSEGEYDLELRLVPMLGFEINDGSKLEAGIEYRLDSFIDGNARNRIFWSAKWYVTF